MALLKLLSTHELVAQLVCFFILLFLLKKFMWGKVLTFLEARKQKIQDEVALIEETKAEIAVVRSEYESKIQEIETRARERIQQAIEEGYGIAEDIRKRAEKEADRVIQSAREQLQYEVIKAKNVMKDNVVDMAMRATEMLVQEKMTETKDAIFIRQFLEEVEKEHNADTKQ